MKPALRSFDDAFAALIARARPVAEAEDVATIEAAGRVLAREQRSTLDVPPMDNTQMDGYAVRVADLGGPAPRLRVAQRIAAGHLGVPLEPGTAARIFTGATIPPGADAVVMQEQVEVDGDHVLLRHVPAEGEWIRRRGEDIAAGSVILAAGTKLNAQATGLAASVGVPSLSVLRKVRVACFFTGDELVMPGEPLPAGAIYNSNRFVLGAMLRALGCSVNDLGIVPDSLAATREALRVAARENDLILTSGGVSVGEEDHVKPAVEAEGEIDLWQIAMKPGKPLAYGRVRRASGDFAHFIGLPGNPVSSFVTFAMLARPFILRLQGVGEIEPRAYALRADFDWPRPDRRREFLRARVNAHGGLDIFPHQGSGVLTSTVWADGLVDNPPEQAIARGDVVRFLPFAGLLS